MTEKSENFALIVFSNFAESGTLVNAGFVSGRGCWDIKRVSQLFQGFKSTDWSNLYKINPIYIIALFVL